MLDDFQQSSKNHRRYARTDANAKNRQPKTRRSGL
jgi:hypothetical protein